MQNRLFNINTKRRSCTTASASVVSAGNSGRCIAATLTVGLTNVTLLANRSFFGGMHAAELFVRDENPTSSSRDTGRCCVNTPGFTAYKSHAQNKDGIKNTSTSTARQSAAQSAAQTRQQRRHAYIVRILRMRQRRSSALIHKFENRRQVIHEKTETGRVPPCRWLNSV